jgi:Cu(I)/Ag(I) efflux system membrane protein CusA/SilA
VLAANEDGTPIRICDIGQVAVGPDIRRDAEAYIFMILYLDRACEQVRREGRLRPKFMTVATMMVGLVPIMWSAGTGAHVMKRIAAPLIGGIVTSFVLELLVYPAIYEVWKRQFELKHGAGEPSEGCDPSLSSDQVTARWQAQS